MREILFRGKRLDNGEWVEGNFYESGISGAYILQNVTRKTVDARTGEITMRDEPVPFEISPSTVGQYTGLHDATKWENLPEKEQQEFLRNHKQEDWNGKRIWEGDIVRYAERRFGGEDVSVAFQVTFDEGGFCVHRYFLNNWLRNGSGGNTKLEDIEIIGNAHDNPELLGGGDEG